MKRFFTKIGMICILIAAQQAIGFSQANLTVEISNDSILIGNTLSVRFKMENVNGDFQEPEFENMEIWSGPNVASSFSSINGQVSNSKTYTYILKPLEEGQFVIFPATVEHEGKELSTEPQTIFVYPNPEQKKQDNSFEDDNNFFFSVPFDMPGIPEPKEKKKARPKLKRI